MALRAKDVFMGIGNAGQRRLLARRDAPVRSLGLGQGLVFSQRDKAIQGGVESFTAREAEPGQLGAADRLPSERGGQFGQGGVMHAGIELLGGLDANVAGRAAQTGLSRPCYSMTFGTR